MFWPKCLTYGNWGGPGWSGGKFVDDPALTDWTVPGIDDMDEAFKTHDYAYQCGSKHVCFADIALVWDLIKCNPKGIWPNAYRIGAMSGFLIKGAIGLILCPFSWLYKRIFG